MLSPRAQKTNRLLSFVAIGTIADCQSVLDTTNRALIKLGIAVLSKNLHGFDGLNELMTQLGFFDKIKNGYQFNSQDIAFTLSPILNSSGRISHAKLSIVALLKTGDNSFYVNNSDFSGMRIEEIVQKLILTNQERKQMVKDVLEEIESISSTQIANKKPYIFLKGYWNKGIIGLIASRLVSQHFVPTFVIGQQPKQNMISKQELNTLQEYFKSLF